MMRRMGTWVVLASLIDAALTRGFRRAPPLKIQEEMGISPTLSIFSVGYFDPWQLANDANFSVLREAELKHGRICMVATLGMAFSDKDLIHALINGDLPPIPAEPAIHALTRTDVVGMLVVCGILETQVLVQRDPQDMPGDYGLGYFGRRDKARHER
jgi:Chlorophyll A-B binding protein